MKLRWKLLKKTSKDPWNQLGFESKTFWLPVRHSPNGTQMAVECWIISIHRNWFKLSCTSSLSLGAVHTPLPRILAWPHVSVMACSKDTIVQSYHVYKDSCSGGVSVLRTGQKPGRSVCCGSDERWNCHQSRPEKNFVHFSIFLECWKLC